MKATKEIYNGTKTMHAIWTCPDCGKLHMEPMIMGYPEIGEKVVSVCDCENHQNFRVNDSFGLSQI